MFNTQRHERIRWWSYSLILFDVDEISTSNENSKTIFAIANFFVRFIHFQSTKIDYQFFFRRIENQNERFVFVHELYFSIDHDCITKLFHVVILIIQLNQLLVRSSSLFFQKVFSFVVFFNDRQSHSFFFSQKINHFSIVHMSQFTIFENNSDVVFSICFNSFNITFNILIVQNKLRRSSISNSR